MRTSYWVIRKNMSGVEIQSQGPFPSVTCEMYGKHWNHQMAIAESHNALQPHVGSSPSRQMVYSEMRGPSGLTPSELVEDMFH